MYMENRKVQSSYTRITEAISGCTVAYNLDGGGSRQLVVDGSLVAGATSFVRSITDAIVVVPKECQMHFTSSSGRIRASVVNGTALKIISAGAKIKLINLYGWIASDGYRWGWGEYDGGQGYFQYDPAVMHPIGKTPNDYYYLVLSGTSAQMKKTVMGSETLASIPIGSYVHILEFMPNIQADGYSWFKVEYDNDVGYIQFNRNTMYPTDDAV